ncbi:helix-turn-helix domain-containing protein [Maribellus comscasis]|nr:helix-turn-helix transcriptional regulator [Maribellus comscasis]
MLRIKEILKDKGITGKQLAKMTSVTPSTITNIVQERNFPKPDLLQNIAIALDVDIRDLFTPTKDTETDFNFKCPNCGTQLTVTSKK